MATDLHYSTVFSADSTGTATVTLAGESSDAPATADYTITVPVTDLGAVVTYTGAYVARMTDDSDTVYPTVTFHTDLLLQAANDFDHEFTGSTAAAMGGDNSSVPTVLQLFRTEAFLFNTPAFTSYPLEAVIGVSYAAPVTASLPTAVGTQPAPTSGATSAPVNLFEQLLAADKIGATGLSDASGDGRATFVENDSISLYVAYSLVKTREFGVDQSGLTGSVHSITVGAVTISDAEKVSEESDSLVKNVRWKFVQTAVDGGAVPEVPEV